MYKDRNITKNLSNIVFETFVNPFDLGCHGGMITSSLTVAYKDDTMWKQKKKSEFLLGENGFACRKIGALRWCNWFVLEKGLEDKLIKDSLHAI